MKLPSRAYLSRARELPRAFIALFFPLCCPLCSKVLPSSQRGLCLECTASLPLSYQWLRQHNTLTELLHGRVPIAGGSAFLFFERGASSQKLVHLFKYHSKAHIAYLLGQLYGVELRRSGRYDSIELVMAVPLHWRRLAGRGYNQSDYFARGLAKTLGVEHVKGTLKRNRSTSQQSLKNSKQARWDNVAGAFSVRHPQRLEGRSIMLVDDVITTGATIEACARAITKAAPTAKIWVGAASIVKKK